MSVRTYLDGRPLLQAWRTPPAPRDFPEAGPAGLPLARRPRILAPGAHLALAALPVLPLWLANSAAQAGTSWPAMLGRFAPLLLACLLAVAAVETLHAALRRRRVETGWYLPAWLFALLLPAGAPLFASALAIALGVLLGRLVFGGKGKHFASPALLGALLLYSAHPAIFAASPFDETTALACGAAALYLAAGGTVSWRILLGGLAGVAAAALLVAVAGAEYALPWHRHLATGAFAFGLVFLAGEPGCAPLTPAGRWFLGVTAGALTVLIRSLDPAHPDGVLHAILLAALFAPLADWLAVRRAVARRRRHEEIWP